jgi:sporulation protein YlmC with PRC-barrel domain
LGIASFLLWAVAVGPSAAADLSPPLYKLQTIIGRAVESHSGQELGHIEEVVIETATGDVAYAVLASGGFLGLGEQLRAIPWRALQLPPEATSFRLGMTAAQLQNAPGFDRKRWPDLEDRHWDDTIQAYYGQPPYWGKHLPTQAARETMEPVQWRLRRYSHIVQSTVMNTRGQRLGTITEVVINAAAGAMAYAVLSFDPLLGGDKLFAIPWRALRQSAGLGTLTLDVDKEALQEAPGFDSEHWPQTADSRWGAVVHANDGQLSSGERRQ